MSPSSPDVRAYPPTLGAYEHLELDILAMAWNRGFLSVRGFPKAVSQYDVPYRTYISMLSVREGTDLTDAISRVDETLFNWQRLLDDAEKAGMNVIVWRAGPDLEVEHDFEKDATRYKLRARFHFHHLTLHAAERALPWDDREPALVEAPADG